MRKLVSQGLIGIVCAVAATGVHAREQGFYVTASAVYTEHDVSKSQGFLLSIGDGPFQAGVVRVYPDSVDVDDGEIGYGATLGYRLNKWVAAEVGYTQFGDAEVTEVYDTDFPSLPLFPPQITRSHVSEISGPTFSVLAMLPLGPFDLFARAGVLFADYTIDTGPRSTPREQTFGDEVILGGVGVDWSFAKRWAARLEYQQTGSLEETFITGQTELQLTTASILFRF